MELLFIIWLGMAIAAAVVAGNKGRNAFGYFVLGLIVPLIGLVIALVISPLERRERALATAPVENGPPPDQRKRCPACAEWIQSAAVKCKHCGADVSSIHGLPHTERTYQDQLHAARCGVTHHNGGWKVTRPDGSVAYAYSLAELANVAARWGR